MRTHCFNFLVIQGYISACLQRTFMDRWAHVQMTQSYVIYVLERCICVAAGGTCDTVTCFMFHDGRPSAGKGACSLCSGQFPVEICHLLKHLLKHLQLSTYQQRHQLQNWMTAARACLDGVKLTNLWKIRLQLMACLPTLDQTAAGHDNQVHCNLKGISVKALSIVYVYHHVKAS